MQDYNIQWGPASFQVLSSFHTEFTDNAFNSAVNRSSDVIIRPEVKLNSYWPITDVNALTFSLGVGYEYYVKNTELNTGAPLISPDSELALLLYVKDFRFGFHERFSYLESLYYGTAYSLQTAQFINLNNIGTFGRMDNFAGFTADWDLSAQVLSFGYDHENFISTLSTLDYLTRASDLLSLKDEFILGPKFRSGLESKATWTAYETHQLADNWRARVGPFVDASPGEYVSLRAGGGYETVLIPPTAGLQTDSTPYYAYARMTHTLNDWLSYSLSVTHENQFGWETANAAVTYVGIWTSWRFIDQVELTPGFYQGWAKESGPDYAGQFWSETYSYFQASLGLAYRFGERWTADLTYAYIQKDSSLAYNGYYRNRINLGVTYRF
jgi:opacity protein-like surface antigen